MDEKAVQAVVAALKEAGSSLGQPAVEAAAAYIRYDAMVGLVFGSVALVVAWLMIKAGITRRGALEVSIVLCALGGVAAIISFIIVADNIAPAIEPLGALIHRTLG